MKKELTWNKYKIFLLCSIMLTQNIFYMWILPEWRLNLEPYHVYYKHTNRATMVSLSETLGGLMNKHSDSWVVSRLFIKSKAHCNILSYISDCSRVVHHLKFCVSTQYISVFRVLVSVSRIHETFLLWSNIFYVLFLIIKNQLSAFSRTYSAVVWESLALRRSVPSFLSNFRDIACWVVEFNIII